VTERLRDWRGIDRGETGDRKIERLAGVEIEVGQIDKK
jgi:hypothetical protein